MGRTPHRAERGGDGLQSRVWVSNMRKMMALTEWAHLSVTQGTEERGAALLGLSYFGWAACGREEGMGRARVGRRSRPSGRSQEKGKRACAEWAQGERAGRLGHGPD